MPPKQQMLIKPGDVYGSLTVLSKEGRSKHGHLQYRVRCKCGKEYLVARPHLFKVNPKCKQCADTESYQIPRCKYHLWEVVQNRLILTEPQRTTDGYRCEMMSLTCGSIRIEYPSAIATRKGYRCSDCPPEYYFTIKGDAAYGILPSGEQFIIDADDLERVQHYYWSIDKDGYITSNDNSAKIKLHNFVLGFTPRNKTYADHINRNRLDCRKSNLRIVTAQQNSMNKSRQKNSTTGYIGVTFDKQQGRYKARIGLNDRRIQLGTSTNPVECAQMYNWAAPIVFGEFAGELNDVPVPTEWIKRHVEEKCKPYRIEAAIATQPCGFLYDR